MPRDLHSVGTPEDWMVRARSNLARARQPKPVEALWEDLCFDAQQAAEKALKAALLARGVPFRFVHDLAELLTLWEQNVGPLPESVRGSAVLPGYAVQTRYPGPAEPVTEEEHGEAVWLAEAVVAWAEGQVKSR